MSKDKHIPQGYKDSPLGIIPKDWEVKRLGSAFHIQGGFAFKSEEYKKRGIPIIRISNLPQNNKYVDLKDCVYSDHALTIPIQFHVNHNDLLIAMSGATTGKVAIYNDTAKAYLNQRVGLFRQISSIITYQYLTFLLSSDMYTYQLKPLLIAGAQPNIAPSDVESLKFPIPPIEEQGHIVKHLKLWDTAIEKQSELIEKLKLRKRALMQQLLTGKKRLPGFSGEWKRIKLGDIAERITRKNEEDNKNVVTISAQRGFVVQTDFFNKSVASETLDNYFLVHRDEFCYNKSYSNGYPMGAIKRLKSFDKAVVTTLYICFKLKNMDSVNIDFFEQYCESGIFNKDLVKVANEGGRAHGLLNVTPADFFNMHMRIPNIDEQNAIATVLVNADKEIELAKDNLTSLQSQKRGLMQQLLTGKIRTTNFE